MAAWADEQYKLVKIKRVEYKPISVSEIEDDKCNNFP